MWTRRGSASPELLGVLWTHRGKPVNWGPAMPREGGVALLLRMRVSRLFAERRSEKEGQTVRAFPDLLARKRGSYAFTTSEQCLLAWALFRLCDYRGGYGASSMTLTPRVVVNGAQGLGDD